MRLPLWFTGFTAGLVLFAPQLQCFADEVLTLRQAAARVASEQTVTVRMVVQSCHPVLPDGKHFRLVSERNFQHEDAFVVHLSDQVVKHFGGHDLNRWFQGKTIRVTGEVEPIVFGSIAETRPGIRVVDREMLEMEISDEPPIGWPQQLEPPLFGSAVLHAYEREAWQENGIDWELQISLSMHRLELIHSALDDESETETRPIHSVLSKQIVLRRPSDSDAAEPLIVNRRGQPLSREEVRERFKELQPIFVSRTPTLPDDWFRQSIDPEAMILITDLSF